MSTLTATETKRLTSVGKKMWDRHHSTAMPAWFMQSLLAVAIAFKKKYQCDRSHDD